MSVCAAEPVATQPEAECGGCDSRVSLVPVWMCIGLQALGIGVTIATLPLYVAGMGAKPSSIARCIAAFSLAQVRASALLTQTANSRARGPRGCDACSSPPRRFLVSLFAGWPRVVLVVP